MQKNQFKMCNFSADKEFEAHVKPKVVLTSIYQIFQCQNKGKVYVNFCTPKAPIKYSQNI